MAVFCIDTETGQVATLKQLVAAGLAGEIEGPRRPWLRIQGTNDATTMWYAVMRKRTRGVYIGALCIRHCDHHASLLEDGWEEVAPEAIAANGPGAVPHVSARRERAPHAEHPRHRPEPQPPPDS